MRQASANWSRAAQCRYLSRQASNLSIHKLSNAQTEYSNNSLDTPPKIDRINHLQNRHLRRGRAVEPPFQTGPATPKRKDADRCADASGDPGHQSVPAILRWQSFSKSHSAWQWGVRQGRLKVHSRDFTAFAAPAPRTILGPGAL